MTELHPFYIGGHFAFGICAGREGPFEGILPGAEVELAVDQAETPSAEVCSGVSVLQTFTKHDELQIQNVIHSSSDCPMDTLVRVIRSTVVVELCAILAHNCPCRRHTCATTLRAPPATGHKKTCISPQDAGPMGFFWR